MFCDLFNRCRSETANELGGLHRKDAKAKKPSGKGGYDPRQAKLSCVPCLVFLSEEGAADVLQKAASRPTRLANVS